MVLPTMNIKKKDKKLSNKRRGRPPKYRKRIRDLHDAGYKPKEIIDKTGIPKPTVHRELKIYEKDDPPSFHNVFESKEEDKALSKIESIDEYRETPPMLNTRHKSDSSIQHQKIKGQKDTKSKTYKPQYPRYDFKNMIPRLHKELGFRKTIVKLLYMRYLWTQTNIEDVREYIRQLERKLPFYYINKGFRTIEKILDLEERIRLVQGRSLVYRGSIEIYNPTSYSRRIYRRKCYEKLFKEYGLDLPTELEHLRDIKIDNRDELEKSGIFEDLMKKAFDQLKIESNVEENIKDWREGKLDDYEKRQLLVHLIYNEHLQNNPHYNEVIETLKQEIGIKD